MSPPELATLQTTSETWRMCPTPHDLLYWMWGRLLGHVSELEVCPDGSSALHRWLTCKVGSYHILLEQVEVKLAGCVLLHHTARHRCHRILQCFRKSTLWYIGSSMGGISTAHKLQEIINFMEARGGGGRAESVVNAHEHVACITPHRMPRCIPFLPPSLPPSPQCIHTPALPSHNTVAQCEFC